MIRKCPSIFFLFLITACAAFSQDTLDYKLTPTEINAQLNATLRNPSNKTLFAPDSLGFYDAVGITAEAVLRQAEGLYVRNYGGHGGVKTVSIRGFSTHQTTFSLNGIPYLSPQTGVVNVGNFYPEGYQEIEVSRSATDPGINPLGGNVNFEVKPVRTSAQLRLGVGTYGERLAGVSAAYVKRKTALQVSIQQVEATDDYPFELNGESGDRKHAAFFSRQYQVYMSQGLGKRWEMDYLLTGFFNRQEVPGPVTKGNVGDDQGDLDTDDLFYYLRFTHKWMTKKGLSPYSVAVSAGYHYNFLDYTFRSQSQLYTSQDVWAQGEMKFLGRRQTLDVVGQFRETWLAGNNLAIRFTPVESVRRGEADLGISHRGYLPVGKKSAGLLTSEAIFRVNYLEAYNLLPNAGLSLTYKPGKTPWEVFVRSHFGYRIPSFNELYYFGYGNADLKPEQVNSLEAGQWLQFKPGIPVTVKTTFFTNRTRNKIISVPINPARWSTLSIGKTSTTGGEVAIEGKVGDFLSFNVAYTLQKAVDLTRTEKPYLPYTPPDIWSYGFKMNWKKLSLLFNAHYSGWRYSLLQNGPLSYMAPYQVLDASLNYTGSMRSFTYRFSLQGENLTGSRYEVVRSYPMPPETLRVVILIKY